ncbi:MAG: preprotein translocase subunit SecG [Spirochaetaceae bacterium]|jgi:preprotein translocase subunit SecG|nr:preprotein translocase subunit SecG [Spirochaetaceae bacterium]
MGVLGIILLVLFIIVSLLLIGIVLIQNEEGDTMGGLFAGGGNSAFGSRSGNVLSRATSILGGVFLVLSLCLALVNRTPSDAGVEAAGRESAQQQDTSNWWQDSDAGDSESAETQTPAE